MDVTLEKYNAKRIYGIPPGLKELLTDISREVLREQPVHIYLFIAKYLEALLEARNCCRAARKAVDGAIAYGELLANITKKYGIDRAAANSAAIKIQATYKGYKTRQTLLRKGKVDLVTYEGDRSIRWKETERNTMLYFMKGLFKDLYVCMYSNETFTNET